MTLVEELKSRGRDFKYDSTSEDTSSIDINLKKRLEHGVLLNGKILNAFNDDSVIS